MTDLAECAQRIVADLMPIAVTVAGDGAADMAGALNAAGAGAELFGPGAQPGYDLALLLADPDPARAGLSGVVAALAEVSDRLLFIPAPLGAAKAADLDAWFELLAEQGYQPVVDYDAGFLGAGAFLVDRNAVAAEGDLAAFADKMSMGKQLEVVTQRAASLEAELGDGGDRAALKSRLAALESEISAVLTREAAWRERAQAAEAESEGLRQQVAAWQGLGAWIAAAVRADPRSDLAALRAAAGRPVRKRGWFRKRAPRASADEQRQIEDAALIRGHVAFDSVWYLTSQPDLLEQGGDPVWHYVLRGAAAGADPAPWFNSAAYVAANPDAKSNPLAHAIRAGHLDAAPAPGGLS